MHSRLFILMSDVNSGAGATRMPVTFPVKATCPSGVEDSPGECKDTVIVLFRLRVLRWSCTGMPAPPCPAATDRPPSGCGNRSAALWIGSDEGEKFDEFEEPEEFKGFKGFKGFGHRGEQILCRRRRVSYPMNGCGVALKCFVPQQYSSSVLERRALWVSS